MSKWLYMILVVSALAQIGCGSTQDQIESARFQLDKGNYENAISILTPLHESEPENNVITGMLASAHLALGLFGTDGTPLGFLAALLRGREAGKSNMESFAAATPAGSSGVPDIYRATDLIAEIPDGGRTKDDHFVKGLSELGTIAGVGAKLTRANELDDPCDFDFDAVDADPENTVRFAAALANVKPDFNKAGINVEDTDMGPQIDAMKSDFELAGNLRTYLENEYGAGGCP